LIAFYIQSQSSLVICGMYPVTTHTRLHTLLNVTNLISRSFSR